MQVRNLPLNELSNRLGGYVAPTKKDPSSSKGHLVIKPFLIYIINLICLQSQIQHLEKKWKQIGREGTSS